MSNTAFTNRKIRTPLSVPNGGTGRTSLTDKAVLIGAGSGNVHTVSPGVSGKVLISDGINWISSGFSPSDGSVTYSKLATDLVGKTTISEFDIDWSFNSIFTKTLTEDTIFNLSNVELNKTITLIISGDFALGFPNTVKTITGTYDGTVSNYITLHCIKVTNPQEFLVTISQEE